MNARARHWITTALALSSLTMLFACGGTSAPGAAGQGGTSPSAIRAEPASMRPPSCARQGGPPGSTGPLGDTTIETIEQAYHCILDNYFAKDTLDNKVLLAAAFAGFTQELQRRGLDRSDATMPALAGDKDRDFDAFAAVYRRATTNLPRNANQPVAAATMNAMVAALDDNHAGWTRTTQPPGAKPGDVYGLGIARVSGIRRSRVDPAATPPLHVIAVHKNSPAAAKGIRAGDVISAINGETPFTGNTLSTSVPGLINQEYPEQRKVRLTLRRPSTGRTWTVSLEPTVYPGPAGAVSAKLLPGNIAYVALSQFTPGVAQGVLKAIEDLRAKNKLRGVVLDVRGNLGGSPLEVDTLLGAFAHNKVTAYHCDADGECVPNRTDDTVPLLNLPLVALTDRGCGSACDHFSAAVKDLGIGRLVGTRTSGVVSGPRGSFVLNDNSVLGFPSLHHLGPNREVINEIGVAPDYFAPRTAKDLSTGRDPAVDKAMDLLED